MALDVIGAGFGRTGTMTLRDALNRLGFGPCYHMSEVINNPPFCQFTGQHLPVAGGWTGRRSSPVTTQQWTGPAVPTGVNLCSSGHKPR